MTTIQKAAFHFRYRWIGFPLLLIGGCLFLFSLSSYRETHDWFVCLLGFGCTMLGLTSFGVNHDTGVAFALLAEKETDAPLSSTMRLELDEDLSWDRSATLAIQPTPKTALLLPWFVIALQFYVFWRLMCVLEFQIVGKSDVCSSPIFLEQVTDVDSVINEEVPIDSGAEESEQTGE